MGTRFVRTCVAAAVLASHVLLGCGLAHITVDGKPVSPVASAENQETQADAEGAKQEIAPQPRVAPRDLSVGSELKVPVVLTFAPTEQQLPIRVTTARSRTISIYSIGATAYFDGQGNRSFTGIRIQKGETLELKVKGNPGRTYYVVVVDDQETQVDASNFVHGRPSHTAPLRERELSEYALPWSAVEREDDADNEGHAIVGEDLRRHTRFTADLFAMLPEEFFVYVKAEHSCDHATGPLLSGEPLVVDFWEGDEKVYIRRANGEQAECRFKDENSELTAQRPSQVVMPPPVSPHIAETEKLWSPEEFLSMAATNARVARYKARKVIVEECFDREWDKRDPDNTADRFNVVSYDSRGNVKKLESMSSRIMREVDAACQITALETERNAIRKEIEAQIEDENRTVLARVAARFAR